MEFIIAAQDDPTPWAFPLPDLPSLLPSPAPATPLLQGRGYFSNLGLIRRKPSRPDAPPTLSKSCSDKLSLKQATSLLSAPVSLLISPENAYLSSLTLPESQYSRSGCERAFSEEGRMSPLKGRKWDGGYRFHPFSIKTTEREFRFSRRGAGKLVPSNLAAAWTPYLEETLIGGVLQGRKQFDPRGASMLCRKSMWKLAAEVATLVAVPAVSLAMNVGSYELVKANGLEGRRRAKEEAKREALRGWVRNEGDEGWQLIGES
jgi:tRNA-specific adenosine deaminase 1